MTKKGDLIFHSDIRELLFRFTGTKRLMIILIFWDLGLIDSTLKKKDGKYALNKYPKEIRKLVKVGLLRQNLDGSPDMSPKGKAATIKFFDEHPDIGTYYLQLVRKHDIISAQESWDRYYSDDE